MKFIKSIFILLVCMISLTVLGATTHQDHKQKPVFSMENSITVNAVNVEIASLESEFRLSGVRHFTLISKLDEQLNYQALLNAGLQPTKGYNYIRYYKEKLNSTYQHVYKPDDNRRNNC